MARRDDAAIENPPLPPTAERAVRRALAAREAAAVDEVQRLLAAGLELMVAGERSPRVADIVRLAGLSNQAFYRHFESKEDLIAAVVERGAQRLQEYVSRKVAEVDDPEAQLRAWITGVLAQAKPHVAAPTRAAMASFAELSSDRRNTVVQPRMNELLEDVLERLGSQDPARDAAFVSAATYGRLRDFLRGEPPTDADLEHAVAFCLAGVRR